MHALRSQLDDVEREVKQHSTILNQILKTLRSLERSVNREKAFTPASCFTSTSAVTPSSDLTSEFTTSFMETPLTEKCDGSIPSCGTTSSMETATPFAFLPSGVFFAEGDSVKKDSTLDTDVPKLSVVHFLEPVELHLNDVFADESGSEGPIEQKVDNPYKHVDTPIPSASQRQKGTDVLSKLVSPTDTFNKAAATKQFAAALPRSSSAQMSKQDRNALPPKRTQMPVAAVKAPPRAVSIKSPPVATTDGLPPQQVLLPRRAAAGNILDSCDVYRRKMTRKLQSESADQLRKQLHTLTPPDVRTLHAAPFNTSTNPNSSTSPTKSSPRPKPNPNLNANSRTMKENLTVSDTSVGTKEPSKSFSYQDFSTLPGHSAPGATVPAVVATVTTSIEVPTRLVKRTSPEKASVGKINDREPVFHTPKVLRSRREAPVSKSSLLLHGTAGNSGSSHSSPRHGSTAVSEAAERRRTTIAATAAIANATSAANKVIAQLQAQNQGKVLRGGTNVKISEPIVEEEANTAAGVTESGSEAVSPGSPAAKKKPLSPPAKSPRRSPKNIQHSPVYTRHADQWSTTRPLSAAKQALMQLQSPIAGGTRRRSVSGASNRSSTSASGSGSAKNSPYSVSGEKSSVVADSVDNRLPTPNYPPPAPPSTPNSVASTNPKITPNTMLTPIVGDSPYTNYHLDSYSKYANIMATPAVPAPTFASESAMEEFLFSHPPLSTPDRDNWCSANMTYPTAPSPRALPMPFPTSPSSKRTNIYTALRATPGAVEVEQSDSDSNGEGDSNASVSDDSIDAGAMDPAVVENEECYSPYSPSAIGASSRRNFISLNTTDDVNDTMIAQPSVTPMSPTTPNDRSDASYMYTTPATTAISLDFGTHADYYTLTTADSNENTNFSTPMSDASDATPIVNASTTNNDLFSTSITRSNAVPNHRYGSHNNTSRVTFAPEPTELACNTSSTTMQANPIADRMPAAGLRRSMTIRTQIHAIGMDDRQSSTGMMIMEPDTPLPAPSPYSAARPSTLDASPFSPSSATATTATTTIYRQCSTYKGTPRPRSRSHSSASADKEDSLDDNAEDNKIDEGIVSGDRGSETALVESGLLENSMDHTTGAKTPEQAFSADTEQQQEQEHSEAVNNSALMDSLIFDYFAQGLNSREDASDGGRESTESEERQGEKQQHEIEAEPTKHWSTAPSVGDITDLFGAFDVFNYSAYHAYIGMVQEGEYMEEAEGDGEDEGVHEGEEEGPNLAEDRANIVAADNNDVGSNSDSDRSCDSSSGCCSDAGDSADPQMGDDSTSPGYSTMYAQLYTNESVYTDGNSSASMSPPKVSEAGWAQETNALTAPTTVAATTASPRRSYAAAVGLSDMVDGAAEDTSILYSPDRPDALQGRARTHARHSSGSFDDICGIKRKDIEDTIDYPNPTNNTTTCTATLEDTTETTAPTTTTTLDTNETNATKEEDMGEKFGEGEGEGGWQGVMGRHSARKKKAHNKAAVQEYKKEKQA